MKLHRKVFPVYLVALVALAGTSACSKTAAVATGAAAAGGAILYGDRGAESRVPNSVSSLTTATHSAFNALGITVAEHQNTESGVEIKGAQGDDKIVVDIERDPGDELTEIYVSVSSGTADYSKSRAEEILRAILQRT